MNKKKLLDHHIHTKSWEVHSDSDIRSYKIACIGKTQPHKKAMCKQGQARIWSQIKP